MRNKKTFKYAVMAGVIAPIFVFSFAFAQVDRPTKSVDQQRTNTRTMDDMRKSDKDGQGSDQMKNDAARRRMMGAGIAHMMENQVNRAEKAIGRLDDIMERVQSRYDKLAAKEGVNLSKVDPLMAQAKKQKDEAVTAINKAKADWEAFKKVLEAEEGDVKSAGKTFMESMKDVNKKLISFHKTLNDVVQAMKRAEPKPAPQPETESSNN